MGPGFPKLLQISPSSGGALTSLSSKVEKGSWNLRKDAQRPGPGTRLLVVLTRVCWFSAQVRFNALWALTSILGGRSGEKGDLPSLQYMHCSAWQSETSGSMHGLLK